MLLIYFVRQKNCVATRAILSSDDGTEWQTLVLYQRIGKPLKILVIGSVRTNNLRAPRLFQQNFQTRPLHWGKSGRGVIDATKPTFARELSDQSSLIESELL